TEYRVLVRNKGSERARRVTLLVPGETFTGPGRARGTLQGISRTVEVGPGLIAPITLLQPAHPDVLGRGIKVFIDGREQETLLQLNPVSPMGGMGMYGYGRGYGRRTPYMYTGGGGGSSQPLLLISRDVNENFFKRTVAAAAFPGGMGGAMVPGGP